MYKEIKLSASIMCADWLNLKNQLTELEESNIDYIHYDVIDGRYAPDFTMGSAIIDLIRKSTKLLGHYHLMVEEPMRIFERFTLNKNDIFTIHQETSKNLHRDIIEVKKKAKVALALSPATSLEHMEYVLEDVENILLLTVNPGFMSQKLIPQTIRKIDNLRNLIDKMKLNISITVDGNVNKNTIPDFLKAGAKILVLGSSGLFIKNLSIKQTMEQVHEAIDKVL
jgi:ribulose-phosphate 3-epimerase|tara:strand:- start:132 stop:806 length:675 start_codon:yes stop_codon:yes gene_type:complete